MDQSVRVAVAHGIDDLPKDDQCGLLFQLPLLFDVGQQLASLQVLHDDRDLHVPQGEAVEDSHDVLMFHLFESLDFYENRIDVCGAFEFVHTDGLYRELLAR